MPDGGFLDSAKHLRLDFRTIEPEFSKVRLRAGILKNVALLEDEWLKMFKSAEYQMIDDYKRPARMSEAGLHLVYGIDWKKVAQRRRENFEYLLLVKEFEDIRLYHDLPGHTVPIGFPIVLDSKADRDDLRLFLIHRKIYCPLHWVQPEQISKAGFVESYELGDRILTIPIDQRYDIEDMARIRLEFNQWLNSKGVLMERTSLAVRVGRIYQKYSPALGFVDRLGLVKRSKLDGYPSVIIIAPPRSGSTLLYQVLTTGVQNQHLTNIWNLLYATPVVGGELSRRVSRNYTTEFNSSLGFVSGLAGEAEGLAFWSYWIGQGIIEDSHERNPERAHELATRLKYLLRPKEAFITGYAGHVFCIPLLAQVFPHTLFVYLKRNTLDNCMSLLKASEDKFWSLRPTGTNFRANESI